MLDELQLANDTIVIFSSDNGPENSQPRPTDKLYYSVGSTGGLRRRKRSLLMGGVNVPFLVRWPGVVPAGRVDKSTALAGVDVFSTLLAAAGIESPAGYVSDGENMLDALKGQSQERTKPVFWWWQGKHSGDDWPTFAMRDGPCILVLDETKQRAELCNVIADRTQSKNLEAEQPERVIRKRAAIDRWFETLPKAIAPELQSRSASRISAKTQTLAERASGSKTMSEQRARAIVRWDTDRDGVLTLDEYKVGLKNQDNLETRFKNFDKNGDGVLSREEFVGAEAK